MKFTKLCVILFSITVFVSCKKEEKTKDIIETNTVEKQTVIVKDTVKVVPVETKGTSVKVNANGVEVESKEVNVEVKK